MNVPAAHRAFQTETLHQIETQINELNCLNTTHNKCLQYDYDIIALRHTVTPRPVSTNPYQKNRFHPSV